MSEQNPQEVYVPGVVRHYLEENSLAVVTVKHLEDLEHNFGQVKKLLQDKRALKENLDQASEELARINQGISSVVDVAQMDAHTKHVSALSELSLIDRLKDAFRAQGLEMPLSPTTDLGGGYYGLNTEEED